MHAVSGSQGAAQASAAALAVDDGDQLLIKLAAEHRSACEAVDPAWRAVLATSNTSPDRALAIAAYNAASHHAFETRERLLKYVRGETSEVGF